MIDSATFWEIKAIQQEGIKSKECAADMELDLEEVNKVYASEDWGQFSGKKIDKVDHLDPARAGYYKGLVAKKAEENDNLKEQRRWRTANRIDLYSLCCVARPHMMPCTMAKSGNCESNLTRLAHFLRSLE